MAITLGIDVSKYQGDINWDQVGATVYDFAVARMTIGRGTRDDLGHRYLSEMVFRVPVAGAYGVVGISEPVTDGAKFLLDEIAADVDPTKILVMLDAENFSDGSHPTIDQVDRYAITIHDQLGRWPVAYLPKWWLNQHGYTAKGRALANCPWAPSHYLPAPWDEAKLLANKPALEFGFKSLAWLQYTSSATVAGVSGNVDANVFYGTLTQLKAQLIGGAPAQEDLSIVDDATKTYLEGKFNSLALLLMRGDATTDPAKDTHPNNIERTRQDIAAVLTAVKAIAPTLDPAQLEQLAALVAAQLVIKGGGYTGTVDLSPKAAS